MAHRNEEPERMNPFDVGCLQAADEVFNGNPLNLGPRVEFGAADTAPVGSRGRYRSERRRGAVAYLFPCLWR